MKILALMMNECFRSSLKEVSIGHLAGASVLGGKGEGIWKKGWRHGGLRTNLDC